MASLAQSWPDFADLPCEFHPLLQRLQELARLPGTFEDSVQQPCVGLSNEEQYMFMPHHPRSDILSRPVLMFLPSWHLLGFSIMKQYEGPSNAFDMLLRRFPEAPGMVIYDNACNLSRYALKREPGFFAKTQFRIDRVHQPGHVGCHEGYNLSSYPDNCSVLGGSMNLDAMNTQVCEQANSSLEAISTQAKFMSQAHFLQYVRYFLYRHNKAKIQKLQEH